MRPLSCCECVLSFYHEQNLSRLSVNDLLAILSEKGLSQRAIATATATVMWDFRVVVGGWLGLDNLDMRTSLFRKLQQRNIRYEDHCPTQRALS